MGVSGLEVEGGCAVVSLAGSKQGKSRGCSRSGSKQQRRQERHFLVPTAAPAPGAPLPARKARKVRWKVRVSGPACRGRSSALPGTWKAKGGKEAARVLVGIFLSSQHSQFGSSARKLIVAQTQTQATFPSPRQIKLAV